MEKEKHQEIVGYRKTSGLQYIIMHLKKYKLLRETYVKEDLSILGKGLIACDFLGAVIKYGAGINDYFQYNFYKRRAVDRKTFIVGRKWKDIIVRCNGTITNATFDDKSLFNRAFDEFLNRDWLDLKTCSYETFSAFVMQHPVFMYKGKIGSGGNGISVMDLSNKRLSPSGFKKLQKKDGILEELIVQHKEMAEFNPSSVNTLRVVTIAMEDRVEIMNAVLRVGNGTGATDNFHHYGLAALIDTETGRVVTGAVDKHNKTYYVHPGSGKQITGFQIPYWSEIVETVKKAAVVKKDVRYVGWDIAIDQEGHICIIEGNCASDPDIVQIPDQVGKWKQYEAIINQLS